MRYDSEKLLLAVDIAGTFLFGIEGADAAIRGNLDFARKIEIIRFKGCGALDQVVQQRSNRWAKKRRLVDCLP